MPVPNSVSIAAGMDDVQGAIERATEYGWIYFLMDLKTVANRRLQPSAAGAIMRPPRLNRER